MTIRLEVLPYAADLWRRLESGWRDLEAASGNASFFLTPTWMSAWLGAYGTDLRPEGLRFLDGAGELVGIGLAVKRVVRRGPFRVQRVYLNATGEGGVFAEHNRLLAKPGAERAVASCLESYVLDADEVALHGFSEDAATDVVTALASRRTSGYWSEDPYVDLERLRSTGRDYLSSRSSETRQQIRRCIRLYEASLGPAAVDTAASPAEAATLFEELRRLHDARWRDVGSPGAFADDRHLAAYHALFSSCGAESGIQLLRVRFGDATVGVLCNFIHRGRVFYSQSGFRYESDNRLKPGLVTHVLAIAHCRERGFTEYDFGAGEPASVRYKTSLATDFRRMAWLEMRRPSLKMALIVGLQLARRRSNWLRRWWP